MDVIKARIKAIFDNGGPIISSAFACYLSYSSHDVRCRIQQQKIVNGKPECSGLVDVGENRRDGRSVERIAVLLSTSGAFHDTVVRVHGTTEQGL